MIIWDETLMMNKLCFEVFDKILRDIMRAKIKDNIERLFAEKVRVFRDDFRQILSIVKNGSRFDIVKTLINYFDYDNITQL